MTYIASNDARVKQYNSKATSLYGENDAEPLCSALDLVRLSFADYEEYVYQEPDLADTPFDASELEPSLEPSDEWLLYSFYKMDAFYTTPEEERIYLERWIIKDYLHILEANQPYIKKPIPAELRWAVFRRDKYRCVECGYDADLTADHIHPEVKGGRTGIDNLQTLCRRCNSKKGAR